MAGTPATPPVRLAGSSWVSYLGAGFFGELSPTGGTTRTVAGTGPLDKAKAAYLAADRRSAKASNATNPFRWPVSLRDAAFARSRRWERVWPGVSSQRIQGDNLCDSRLSVRSWDHLGPAFRAAAEVIERSVQPSFRDQKVEQKWNRENFSSAKMQ